MTKNSEGKYCCECDFCSVSPCDNSKGIESIFFRDNHNYYLWCNAHVQEALKDIKEYAALHNLLTENGDGDLYDIVKERSQ